MDEISLKRISQLHPQIKDLVFSGYKRCIDSGVFIRITQGLRTIIEQDELYAQGRTKPGKIVTYARGGFSIHNYALAFDFCLLHLKEKEISWSMIEDIDGDSISDWMEVVAIFEGLGFEWGGKWAKPKTDTPHFQMTFGLSVREMMIRMQEHKVDKNGFILLTRKK